MYIYIYKTLIIAWSREYFNLFPVYIKSPILIGILMANIDHRQTTYSRQNIFRIILNGKNLLYSGLS